MFWTKNDTAIKQNNVSQNLLQSPALIQKRKSMTDMRSAKDLFHHLDLESYICALCNCYVCV